MEPKDFARVIFRRKRTVITAIVVVVVSVFFASMRKAPVYVAECKVLFQAAEFDVTNPNAVPVETVGGLESNQALITSPEIALPVADELKLPLGDVLGKVNVEIIKGTQIFLLRVADAGMPHPVAGERPAWKQNPGQRAGDICNAYANAYIAFKKREAGNVFANQLVSKKASLRAALKEFRKLQSHFDGAKTQDDRLSYEIRRDTLLRRISDLQGEVTGLTEQLSDGIDGGGKLIQAAGPGAVVGADHKRDLLMGLIVGLLFGVGLALVREYLDDTVRDKESTQRELGLPVLAAIPAADDFDGLDEPSTGAIEAARTLRATLASLGFPHEKRMLVVTSSLAKRRSTTLASLAAAVAESGRSVLVVGSDLRGGRTHEAFGIHNSVGLANVVRGQVPLEKAVRPAPGMDGVYVLPCGPVIGNPGELLSSEAMAMTLRRARRWADVVLLDAPPVLSAADSSILGAYADGVVLVVSAGQTNRGQANEAKEQLIAAGARVMGAVLVGSEDTVSSDEFGDDLGSLGDWGSYGGGSYGGGSFDAGFAVDDPYASFDDDGYTISAYAEPRAPRRRQAPAKKTAASRAGQRPKAKKEPSLPRSGVRTTSSSRARGARAGTTAKRSTGTAKRSTGTAKRSSSTAKRSTAKKPAARKTTSAARKSTARAGAPRRTTVRTSTTQRASRRGR